MTNLQRKFTTALATGAVLANAFVPAAFASTDLTITGNGSNSDSNVNVTKSNDTVVTQNNTANVENKVKVDANTGGNSASDNTGGDVRVKTGDATTKVNVENMLNSNVADVQNCGGCDQDLDVKISGNGTKSDNKVDVDFKNNTQLFQTNNADVKNDVKVDANSGDNNVDDNTGGDVVVVTGDIDTTVKLMTVANANSARIGGSSNGETGELSARILGNGSHSDNDIYLDFNNDILLTQDNNADIENDVDVDADSGYNDVEDNTGGEVALLTGDVDATVIVDNMVNFNAADVEDCCFGDLAAKVAGNGTDSDNKIDYDTTNALDVFQDNAAELDNDLDVDGDTGDNDVDDNTGAYDAMSDPYLETGSSESTVKVQNDGGMNVYGSAVDVEFDFSDLMDWFHSFTN